MLSSNTVSRQLDINVAVALRLVRKGAVPREFFKWLANPAASQGPPARWVNSQLSDSLSAIVASVTADASLQEQLQVQAAPQWMGAISNYMAQRAGADGVHCMRLLAASLLPLYRTLATGKLHEGFKATQERLMENLVLLGLCSELGAEFRDLLEFKLSDNGDPLNILQDEFNLNLMHIGQTILRVVVDYDASTDRFSAACHAELFDNELLELPSVAEWATPPLLWRLAGELIAKKPEMVLPRPWIDTPVPWSKIAEHWNRLNHTLVNLSERAVSQNALISKSNEQCEPSTRSAEKDVEATLTIIRDAVDQEVMDQKAVHQEAVDREVVDDVLQVDTVPRSSMRLAAAVESNDELASEADILGWVEQSRLALNTPVPAPLETCIPKVMLAEIRSHNDPVFVKVVRRKLACCRTEERALCLSHIVVTSDDETQLSEVTSVRDNGLTLWQQKLVNWLADHPHVNDPYAFLTTDGELILCVLDLERNEMTSILRQGLVEVLSGKHVENADDVSLARVNIPARFHAGISATSSPGANMTAEQLIEPAIRCLTAAQRHGRASIKSIEVY